MLSGRGHTHQPRPPAQLIQVSLYCTVLIMASLVVGLNSGTSMDGVDAVLLEISEDPDAK